MGELIAYFNDRQAAELARISVDQLRRWRSSGVLVPENTAAAEERGVLNSFRDVVGLRTLGMLRKGSSLQELRRVSEWLHQRYASPWASLRFSQVNGAIHFQEPKTGLQFTTHPEGQKVIVYDMGAIAQEVESEAKRLLSRPSDSVGKVSARGIIEGTRIPAAAICSFVDEGVSAEDILKEYPSLSLADVRAAIAYERARKRAVVKRSA